MDHNVGMIDKIVRIVIGVVIIGVGIYFRSWWGLIGLIPLVTATINFCPLYSVFKWNTNKK